ncbi:hypothetical protein ACJ72_05470 [Emergomyces africanus]|uniref:Uncharacterized protein n=1 Tax=Emergomyces africanus TaxID=1955775 RepID=A0A1B7NTU3_9EURO|nr:hypothetical protein ACJ72_05470 [Emergomyces africanus]
MAAFAMALVLVGHRGKGNEVDVGGEGREPDNAESKDEVKSASERGAQVQTVSLHIAKSHNLTIANMTITIRSESLFLININREETRGRMIQSEWVVRGSGAFEEEEEGAFGCMRVSLMELPK